VNLVAAESDCYVDLNIVAIGGGGGGSYFKAGRGSGYVETSSVRMLNTRSPLEITVGQLDQSSKLGGGTDTKFHPAGPLGQPACFGAGCYIEMALSYHQPHQHKLVGG